MSNSIHPVTRWLLVAILLSAFGLRVSADYPDGALNNDPKDYHTIAYNLLNGTGYVEAQGFAYQRQPGYPYVLAAAYALGGVHSTVGVWLQALLGTLTVAITFRAGLAFDRKMQRAGHSRSARLSVIAALIVAVDPFLIVQDQTLLVEGLYTLGITLLLWQLLSPPARRRSALVGAIIGGLTLVRSNGITLVLTLLRLPPRWIFVAVSALIVVLLPWSLRNLVMIGIPSPLAPQTGTVLLGTYNEVTRTSADAAGMWVYPPGLLEGVAYVDLPFLERERAWTAVALEFIRQHPGDIPRMMAQRLARWAIQPMFVARDALHPALIGAQPVFFFALLILALQGVAILVLERQREVLLTLGALVLPAAITVAVFFGEARFRAPYHPMLALLASVVMARLVTLRRR